MISGGVVTAIIIVSAVIAVLLALVHSRATAKVSISGGSDNVSSHLLVQEDGADKSESQKIVEISNAISEGANAFLSREYVYMAVFTVLMSIVLVVVLGATTKHWLQAMFTAISFVAGAVTSILSGWIGMRIAVFANSRTAVSARQGYGPAFTTAFKAGAVMGFSLVALGISVLYILINILRVAYYKDVTNNQYTTREMFEAVAGYGLGGSSIALFGRVGGGIYTKAADVGADLCGKLEFDIPEDDPRNPAVIADNVGDNVGDIAGMGADLFGSFAEASSAALVISATQHVKIPGRNYLNDHWGTLMLPVLISAVGVLVCFVTSFVATHLIIVSDKKGVEPSLKRQILVSTLLSTPAQFLLIWYVLPKDKIVVDDDHINVKSWQVFLCVMCGLWSGMIIGYITEYFTSNAYKPVQEVSHACSTGAATNIIYGLALGYKSVIIPAFCLAITIYVSYSFAGMYGISMAALGILSTMSIGLTIDAYGPICDNAGGIAEMAGMPGEIRDCTDALDAAGNTTAAIGKGFAIGSAALVSLALFGAFVTTTFGAATLGSPTIDILRPFVFAGLLIGAMLPFWFSAMTMKSVGQAALAMVEEVRYQFESTPQILEGTVAPNYTRCVDISTDASLREMIPPGILVMGTPLIVGFLFGIEALAGVLVGALVSGVQVAISSSNSGGAWDNAKKYIESGMLGENIGKGSLEHKAAVVGDTVGDPLKDTSGPALNILIKLSAIISVVFAPAMQKACPLDKGGLIQQLFN